MLNWNNYLNFTRDEFDSPDEPGSGDKMNPDFMEALQEARSRAAIPFKINSGYRTDAHNKRVGGKYNSSHLTGLAADIAVHNDAERFAIVYALLSVGFDRIGVGKGFIHVDLDTSKNDKRMWVY